jgi:hypothetical protein
MCVATGALAQTPAPREGTRSTAPSDAQRARYQIRVLERVFEQAVQHGTQVVALQFRTLAPSAVLFVGTTLARGFALDEYGVFFDVQVPSLRRSLTWTFRTLNRNGLSLDDALTALRQHVQSLGDPGARDALEQALRSLEVRVGPLAATRWNGARATRIGAGDADRPAPAPATVIDIDPADVYASQIRDELVGVMLDHSGSLALGPDDWLTVAATGAASSWLGAAASATSAATAVMLRIRGRDLAALRAGDISRSEAQKRIHMIEF